MILIQYMFGCVSVHICLWKRREYLTALNKRSSGFHTDEVSKRQAGTLHMRATALTLT